MSNAFELGQRVWVKAEVITDYGDHYPWEVIAAPEPRYVPTGTWMGAVKRLFRRELKPPIGGILIGRTKRYTGIRTWEGEEVGCIFEPHSCHVVYLIAQRLQWRTPVQALGEDIEALESSRIRENQET